MLLTFAGDEAGAASGPYVDLDQHEKASALSAGTEDRVVVRKRADGSGRVRLSKNPRSATDTAGLYNGGRYYYGTLTSRVYAPSTRFDTLVPSWNAATPGGTWVQLEARVRSGGGWTRWFNLGVWASGTGDVKRHSVNRQRGGDWEVLTDTLQSRGPVFADAYQYRLKLMAKEPRLSPTASKVSVVASDSYRHGDSLGTPVLKDAWGKSLAVPARSQMVYEGGGEVWCSPTSLSMVMAYWAKETGRKSLNQSVPTVARGTYDYVYRGNGNWPFNTAYAAAYGLEGTVSRFSSIEQAERWISSGIPLVASVAWDNRQASTRLSGAPIPVTEGHLLVIRGFTTSGDPIVNDPAAGTNAGVPRVYDREELERAWLRNPNSSGGAVYLVHPRDRATPPPYAANGSW
jgi:hypothetical protein